MKDQTPREKAQIEQWFFVAKWCKDKGVSPMEKHNYDKAVMEWVKQNTNLPSTDIKHP